MPAKPTVIVRPLADGDLQDLIARMRQADIDEVLAASGDIEASLVEGVRESVWLRAVDIDGQLACVFGLVALDGLLGTRAAPWLLGTVTLERHPAVLLRHAPDYVAAMQSAYPHLLNFVDARNGKAVRFLRWLGFTLQPAQPYGVSGLPFHRFDRSNRPCANPLP